jgi:hypothetical protein
VGIATDVWGALPRPGVLQPVLRVLYRCWGCSGCCYRWWRCAADVRGVAADVGGVGMVLMRSRLTGQASCCGCVVIGQCPRWTFCSNVNRKLNYWLKFGLRCHRNVDRGHARQLAAPGGRLVTNAHSHTSATLLIELLRSHLSLYVF